MGISTAYDSCKEENLFSFNTLRWPGSFLGWVGEWFGMESCVLGKHTYKLHTRKTLTYTHTRAHTIKKKHTDPNKHTHRRASET